jgi:hypothetical protein
VRSTAQWLIVCVLLLLLLVQHAQTEESPASADWSDCLACHESPDEDLPSLAELRPVTGGNKLGRDCNECHTAAELTVPRSDWRHPLRPVAAHLSCIDCHPAVPHSADSPPPQPVGDYTASACYACHQSVKAERHMFSQHGERGDISCRDCHPAHGRDYAELPLTLLPVSTREAWQGGNDWYLSNSKCLACHASGSLFFELAEGFVDSKQNLHDLHVTQREILCVECHAPHGSLRHRLLRQRLITGELLQSFESVDGATCAVVCHGFDHDGTSYGKASLNSR